MKNGINLDDRILASLVAISDAIWLPDRSTSQRRRTIAYERQRDFQAHGVLWNSARIGAASEAARKRVQKRVACLAERGLLEIHRPRVRTLAVKLTEAGDAQIRELCGLATVDATLELIDELPRLPVSHRLWWPGYGGFQANWVSERVLLGNEFDARTTALTEEDFVPLAMRGLVIANSDSLRNVFYALTPTGVRRAADRVLAKLHGRWTASDELTPHNETVRRFYFDRLKRELAALDAAEPQTPSELGRIPIHG